MLFFVLQYLSLQVFFQENPKHISAIFPCLLMSLLPYLFVNKTDFFVKIIMRRIVIFC